MPTGREAHATQDSLVKTWHLPAGVRSLCDRSSLLPLRCDITVDYRKPPAPISLAIPTGDGAGGLCWYPAKRLRILFVRRWSVVPSHSPAPLFDHPSSSQHVKMSSLSTRQIRESGGAGLLDLLSPGPDSRHLPPRTTSRRAMFFSCKERDGYALSILAKRSMCPGVYWDSYRGIPSSPESRSPTAGPLDGRK